MRAEDLAEILDGIGRSPRILPPRLFYDEAGSALFERICDLPEYYLTRTELGIMRRHLPEMADRVGPDAMVMEFGAGAGTKTRLLLEALQTPVAYLPVDVSGELLAATAARMRRDFPAVEILPVTADFTRPFPLPSPARDPNRKLVYFPGSTIGNFPPEDAVRLLRVMRDEAGEGGALLIGIDLPKDRQTLERAYNDAEGVTAAFNLNMLNHLNRDFGADFDLAAFRHRAIYDAGEGRIEMHLVSEHEQVVTIGGHAFGLKAGEAIVTEYSYKYDPGQFADMLEQAGFHVAGSWADPRDWFRVLYCESGA